MTVTIARTADGTWWATAKMEQTLSQQEPRPTDGSAHRCAGAPVVGVDRGITISAVAATAQGEVTAQLPSGTYLRGISWRLAHAQRRAARRRRARGKAGSANHTKAKARVARLHTQVAAQRSDAPHTFTAALTRAHPVIVVGALAAANLLANGHLARSISDQGWREMARQITYKTTWRGGVTLVAPRFFPSSVDVFGVWVSESQADPGRPYLPLRVLPPGHQPGR